MRERSAELTQAVERVRKAVLEHDQFNRYDPQGCKLTTGESQECVTIWPALAAALRLAAAEGAWWEARKNRTMAPSSFADAVAELAAARAAIGGAR